MIIPTIQAQTNPTTNGTSQSDEIKSAEIEVGVKEATADRVNRFLTPLLIAYGVLSLAIALVSWWGISANRELRLAGNILLSKQQERATNAEKDLLDLYAAIQPRNLGEQSSLAELLKPFAGTRVIIVSLADAETSRTAGHLAFALQLADWKIEGMSRTLDESIFFDGISIFTTFDDYTEEVDRVEKAARLLAEELTRRKVKANHYAVTTKSVSAGPPLTLVVRIGFKPDYFSEKGDQKRAEEMQKKTDEEFRKKHPEILKQFPDFFKEDK